SSDFSISMGYQYLVAKDQAVIDKIKKDELFARDPVTLVSFKLKRSDYFGLYNRSKHIANIKINYLIPLIKTSLSARFFYRSQYGLFDSNNNAAFDRYDNFVKGYFLTNITLNKDFKGQISGQIGVNNLLDYKDENNISNLPGRQFFAKIQYYY
nr:TonB-dependent receptor [Chitinophagales bacterium]